MASVAQLVVVLSPALKGHRFDSQSGQISSLPLQSPPFPSPTSSLYLDSTKNISSGEDYFLKKTQQNKTQQKQKTNTLTKIKIKIKIKAVSK